MNPLSIADRSLHYEVITPSETTEQTVSEHCAAIIDLFASREAEFDFHESVDVNYPDLSDTSTFGFLSNAAEYAARQAEMLSQELSALRVVILTTYGDRVRSSCEAAGYSYQPIEMPAGPEHTAAFILEPRTFDGNARTLYIEAVNENDDKIKPTFVMRLTQPNGDVCGGAFGSIHEREGRRYAYLAAMTLASGLPQGTGVAFMEQLLQYLKSQSVEVVHVGTQTAAKFYEKAGFKVEHRLIKNLRIRHQDGQKVEGDLAILSRAL